MSVEIIRKTVAGETGNWLVLGNAAIGAKLARGTDWTRIRIGFRYAVESTGANISGSPRLWVGVMSNPTAGMTNGPLGSATSHFVGVRSYDSLWWYRTGYYDGTSGNPLYGRGVVRVGDVTVEGASGSVATIGKVNFVGQERRWWGIAEIRKGSPNFTVGFTNNAADTKYDAFIESLLNPGTIGSTGSGVAVNEAANGPLNAICIAWDRLTPRLHFSEIAFTYLP
jgi:hypothetical protein